MTGTNKYDTHALKKNYTAQHLISQAQDAQFADGSVVPADLHTGLTLIHGHLLRQLCFAAAVPSYTDRAWNTHTQTDNCGMLVANSTGSYAFLASK